MAHDEKDVLEKPLPHGQDIDAGVEADTDTKEQVSSKVQSVINKLKAAVGKNDESIDLESRLRGLASELLETETSQKHIKEPRVAELEFDLEKSSSGFGG